MHILELVCSFVRFMRRFESFVAERHEGISVGILVRTGLENSRCLRYGNMDIIVGWEKLRLLSVGGVPRSGSVCTSRYFFSAVFFLLKT